VFLEKRQELLFKSALVVRFGLGTNVGNRAGLLAVGGTDNHVHLLLSLPATMPLAKAMQLLKGGSSKWMNDSGANAFAWQQGYGAFSVGISQQAGTISYIRSQAEHHHKRGFEEEFLAFLKKHRIEYDPSQVWG
jgi:hypothetical protein